MAHLSFNHPGYCWKSKEHTDVGNLLIGLCITHLTDIYLCHDDDFYWNLQISFTQRQIHQLQSSSYKRRWSQKQWKAPMLVKSCCKCFLTFWLLVTCSDVTLGLWSLLVPLNVSLHLFKPMWKQSLGASLSCTQEQQLFETTFPMQVSLTGHCAQEDNWSDLMAHHTDWGFPNCLFLLSINI